MTKSHARRSSPTTSNQAATPPDPGPQQDVMSSLAAEMTELRVLLNDLGATTILVANRLDQIEQRLTTLERRAHWP